MDEPDQKKPRRLTTYIEDGKDGYVWESADTAVDWSKPFVADVPADDDVFEPTRDHWRALATWPPHMAVAWVARPTWEEIVAQAKRQTGGPGMREASEAVLMALQDGRLIAWGMREDGRMGLKASERITPEEWRGLIWIGGTLSTAALDKGTGERVFLDVQIDRLGLLALWPDESAEPDSIVNEDAPKVRRRRGRPTTVMPDVVSKMLDYLRSGKPLDGWSHEALAKQFGGSANTAAKARDLALSKFPRGNS